MSDDVIVYGPSVKDRRQSARDERCYVCGRPRGAGLVYWAEYQIYVHTAPQCAMTAPQCAMTVTAAMRDTIASSRGRWRPVSEVFRIICEGRATCDE